MIDKEMQKLRLMIRRCITALAIVIAALLTWLFISVLLVGIYAWATRRPSEPDAVDYGFAIIGGFISIPAIGVLITIFYELYKNKTSR
jgi:uncharacterized BrkB/YihY/UPF0761 family membrane protein